MAQPTSRDTFKKWCLRKLGAPVIEINVDADQVDDRVDEALSYWWDYHFDGVEKTYLKHKVVNSVIKLTTQVANTFTEGEVIRGLTSGARTTIAALANTSETVGSLVIGREYIVTSVGDTSNAQWAAVGFTGGGAPTAGSSTFIATAPGASGTTGTVSARNILNYKGKPVSGGITEATANVNGAVQSSASLVLDGNSGTIKVGMIVVGTGISATTTVKTVTDQNNITLDRPQILDDNTALTFVSTNSEFLATETIRGESSGATAVISTVTKGTVENEYIEVPEEIIGAVNVFNIGSNISAGAGMFNVEYQFILHNLHDIVNYNLTNFFMSMSNLRLMEELLVGAIPLRYNRHDNKLFLDVEWDTLPHGEFIVVEAYSIVDPNIYADVWKDRWLQNYATAKIKYQWGSNLTKFNGMTLPGNVQFNGEQILNDAREEIQRLEDEIFTSHTLPASDMIG
tara:strand:+ start:134 stop:1501 length:1368 start_codon:yes stop_codon:yes gene_type:complete